MGKILGVVSGKGGVGKSTVSIGLAAAFCSMGKKVLLVDMDEGLRCLDLMLGMDEKVVFDLADVLDGKDVEDVLSVCEYIEGLYLIPAPLKSGGLDTDLLYGFAEKVSDMFDTVIFDFPAGINKDYYSNLPENTMFLTVAVPDAVSIRDASFIGDELYKMQFSARLIINRFIFKQSLKYKFKNIDSIIDTASLRLVGIVPESRELGLFSLKHRIRKRSKAFKALKRIARRIDGENILLPKIKKI